MRRIQEVQAQRRLTSIGFVARTAPRLSLATTTARSSRTRCTLASDGCKNSIGLGKGAKEAEALAQRRRCTEGRIRQIFGALTRPIKARLCGESRVRCATLATMQESLHAAQAAATLGEDLARDLYRIITERARHCRRCTRVLGLSSSASTDALLPPRSELHW